MASKHRTGGRGSLSSSIARRRAHEVVRFIEHALYHTKGPFAGRAFKLTRWQKRDIIEPVFGTLLPDGRRAIRTVFVEIPRKNGKSQISAAIALVMLFI